MYNENSIVVDHVSKKYNGFQLEDVSFKLPKGCIMGLIGENGAGKSTTIKIILDLIRKDSGNVEVLGRTKVGKKKALFEDIGVVFDEGCFPEELTASDIGKSFRKIYKQWDDNAYQSYLSRFMIPEKKSYKQFSRGMKMKLAISVALSHNPKLLILDEATSGLDPIVRDSILDVFMEFIQNEENSILLSSHIVSDLEKICDYITFIHDGKVVLMQEKDVLMEEYVILKCSQTELMQQPKNAVVSFRKNKFGVEALVKRAEISGSHTFDKATLEDIMLFVIKGGKLC